MVDVKISFPDDLLEKVETRAKQIGYETLEEYVTSLVQDDIRSGGQGGPPTDEYDQELEELLDARLKDQEGTIEVTPEFFESLKKDLHQRLSQ